MQNGAHEQIRTADRLLTMQVLYQLSYVGPLLHCLSVFTFPTDGPLPLERETRLELATLSLEG
jgi:hypothetical protein